MIPLTKPDHGRARLAELACGQKRSFATRDDAEQQAQRHYSCHVCLSGTVRMDAYYCALGDHYHVGHMGVRP